MSNPTTPGQKLNFRIVDFSGEDPQYPATELLTGSPQSKGWQSQRFCDWPQHITMQFFGPVKLKQIQFLSHQCKISTKIELFSALPNLRNPTPDTELKFKKLGYLSLDSNERSGYQSRELKTVYIDSPCLYLKIVFHKCHLNKFNLFNQVGLIALGVFGDPLNTIGPKETVDPVKAKYDRLEYETQFDPSTVQKMKDLEDAKARAVEREDFEEAKRIKLAIDRLRHIGAQLQHLEEAKARAIRNEDYDGAKVLKIEIDKLREAFAPGNVGRQPTRELTTKNQQFTQPQKMPMTPERVRGASQEDLQIQQDSQALRHQEEEKKYEPQVRNSYKYEEKNVFGSVPHDEIVPSAIGGGKEKGQQMMSEYPEGHDERSMTTMAETLSAQNSKFAEPLIPVIGDELARKIFSKTWNNREEALKILEGDLTGRPQYINNTDTGAVFVAYMGAISYTINDKVNQVVLASMSLLQTLISKPPPHVPSKNELMSYVDGVVNGLLEKIGDNNARTRETAEGALIGMANHPLVTCNFCVTSLTKNMNPTKHKTSSSIKHIVARLNILRQLVEQFRINTKEVPYQPVVDFAVDKLENSAPEVRQAASHLLVDIYAIVGGRIMTDLAKVRPNQMELLQKEFDAVDGVGGQRGGHQEDNKKPIITTNINPHGNKKPGKSNLKNAAGPSSGAQGNRAESPGLGRQSPVSVPVCEFCDRKDKNLTDPKKMDIHLWKECPMLTTCVNCAQIVEVSMLNKHLLDECDNKKVMRRCPRCKEAIHMEEYQQHTEEMSCSQALPLTKANRCPLCHQDIGPGEMGWKKHLLTEGCPNNERTM